jgi:hypothetical protein
MPISESINLTEEWIIALSGICFFCIFFTTSLINLWSVMRREKPNTHVSSILAGKIINFLFLGFILITSFSGLMPKASFFDYLYLFVCINVCVKVNWNLFAATDTSMHSKLLTTIYMLGPISHDNLLKLYNRTEIFKARIPRMLALDQIQVIDGKYVLTGRFVLFGAKLLALFRLLLGIPVRPALNNPGDFRTNQ